MTDTNNRIKQAVTNIMFEIETELLEFDRAESEEILLQLKNEIEDWFS